MSHLGGGSDARIAILFSNTMTVIEQLLEFRKLFTTEDVTSVHGHNFTRTDPNILHIGTTRDNLFTLLVKGGGITIRQSSDDTYGKSVSITGKTPEELIQKFLKVLDGAYECIISSDRSWGSSSEGFAFFIRKNGNDITRFKVNASYGNNSSASDYDSLI